MGYIGNQITTVFPSSISVTDATLSGNLTVGGTATTTGLLTANGNVVIPDGGTIGSASDTDALSISSGGILTQSAPVISIMTHTASLTVPDNSFTVIPFQTSDVDTNGLYDATNDRLLITSEFNGNYFLISWRAAISGGTNGDNMLGRLRKNTAIAQEDHLFLTGDEGEQVTFQGNFITTVSTGDYFDVGVFSDQSGGSKSSLTGLNNSALIAFKLF
tara:strand:+ start:1318 stop:1968 length:651 start_codon:yes stop_codon:yes gene_type:complete